MKVSSKKIEDHADSLGPLGSFDGSTPGETVAQAIDRIKAAGTGGEFLVSLLPQQHKIYSGRGGNQAAKLRGYILASFEKTGLPVSALRFVLEELENSQNAYLTAAAARALRGSEHCDGQVIPYLQKAVANISHMDDAIDLDTYTPEYPLKNYTTALTEILLSLKWLGSHAESALPFLLDMSGSKLARVDEKLRELINSTITAIKNDGQKAGGCCGMSDLPRPYQLGDTLGQTEKHSLAGKIEFEDQDGNRFLYEDFFREKPAVVVFFYTRCDNPNKCSLTITKIAQVQQRLKNLGIHNEINIASITYDSGYDRPERLKGYGADRNFIFSERHRSLRLINNDEFKYLAGYLGLGVNYAGSIVNHHRIELFLLDRHGKVVREFSQIQWDVDEIVKELEEISGQSIN